MKIFEVLNKIEKYKSVYKSLNEMVSGETPDTIKQKLSSVASEIISKRDARDDWKVAGADISTYVNKIIELLSVLLTKSRDEIEEYYDINHLTNIYYYANNLNLEIRNISDNLLKLGVGKKDRFHATRKDKNGNPIKLKKPEEFNIDLYRQIIDLFNRTPHLAHELSEYFVAISDKNTTSKYKQLNLESFMIQDPLVVNDAYKDIFSKTGLSLEIINELGQIKGSKQPSRGAFEMLLAILFEGGKVPLDEKGDLIVNNHKVEVKADIKGAARIGGGQGFNNVEYVISNYQKIILQLISEIEKRYISQIPENNTGLLAEWKNIKSNSLMISEDNSSCSFIGNIVISDDTKYPNIDEIYFTVLTFIKKIIGDLNNIADDLYPLILTSYKQIWTSLVNEKSVNDLIINLINLHTSSRTLDSIMAEHSVIPKRTYSNFVSAVCFIELGYYAKHDDFDYIFIIKYKAKAKKVSIISKEKLINFAAECGNSINAIQKILALTQIKFVPPASYPSAERGIKPGLTLI